MIPSGRPWRVRCRKPLNPNASGSTMAKYARTTAMNMSQPNRNELCGESMHAYEAPVARGSSGSSWPDTRPRSTLLLNSVRQDDRRDVRALSESPKFTHECHSRAWSQ